MNHIRATDLMLRCYANKHDKQWQAFCIDYSLAAQGTSFQEARQKLDDMICEYLYDALAGEDQEFAEQLLNRKAPLSQIATYHWIRLMHRIGFLRDECHKLFKEVKPLVPLQHHSHA